MKEKFYNLYITKGMSISEVAKELGMSKENLNGYKSRGSIPSKAIADLCLRKHISINKILGDEHASFTTPSHNSEQINEHQGSYPPSDSLQLPESCRPYSELIKKTCEILVVSQFEIIPP